MVLGLVTVSPAGGLPPHYQLNEDQWFLVQEGRAAFLVGGQWREVPVGTRVFIPRTVVHTFKNVGDTPLRMLFGTSPAGFEKYIARCTDELAKPGSPNKERLVQIAAEHGIHFAHAIIEAFTESGVVYTCEYHDADSFDGLENSKCRQVYAVCFCREKMVIGFGGQKQGWGLVGGTVEAGETFEQTLAREVREESNMKVLVCRPIGYQKVSDPRDGSSVYQLRYVCVVEPLGSFVADPASGVTKIKLIDPAEYRKYFDWGEIGERIVERAMELKKELRQL